MHNISKTVSQVCFLQSLLLDIMVGTRRKSSNTRLFKTKEKKVAEVMSLPANGIYKHLKYKLAKYIAKQREPREDC